MAVRGYLHLQGKSDQDLLSEEFETVERDSKTPRAVAETWFLSFDQIQQQNVLGGELLSFMSFFDRQALPREFFAYYGEQRHQGERWEMQLQKALGVLKAFSFVTTGKDQSLDVHRLVQLVSRKWLAREKRMKHFTEQPLFAVSHAYPFGDYENWVTCGRYLPHANAVLELECSRSKDGKTAKAFLLHNAAWFILFAERLQTEAVDLRRNVLGADHPDTLTSMASLASTYRIQGRWEEAEKLEVQVTETRKTKLGADHPNTLASMANLACTWQKMGRHEDALSLIQVCFTLQQRRLGPDHPHTVSTLQVLQRWKIKS